MASAIALMTPFAEWLAREMAARGYHLYHRHPDRDRHGRVLRRATLPRHVGAIMTVAVLP